MNIKDQAYSLKTQFNALFCLIEGMEAANWDDETPIGISIFMKSMNRQMGELYKAIPAHINEASGASRRQKKRRRHNRHGRGFDHEEK